MSVRKEVNKYGNEVTVVDHRWPDGKRFRREMPNRTVAKQLDDRIRAAKVQGTWRELRDELVYGAKHTWTFSEFADHYFQVYCQVRNKPSSCQRKMTSIQYLRAFLGDKDLKSIEVRDVNLFVAWRTKEDDVKPATINRDLAVLRHMFEFAVDEGALTKNPIGRFRKLTEMRGERPRVSEAMYLQIRRNLPFPVKQIVTFIWETGCRPSEALALRRDQVDCEAKTAIFNMRKAGDNALVGLTSRAVEAVQQVPALPGCPFVFWNPQTQTKYERINETFRRAREHARLPHVQLKDFRREAAIVMAESGQPLHVAQTQLGHSSIKTTEKYYAHFQPSFAATRAREVLEARGESGRQTGGDPAPSTPAGNAAETPSSNILPFQRLRRVVGGGERIRTAE